MLITNSIARMLFQLEYISLSVDVQRFIDELVKNISSPVSRAKEERKARLVHSYNRLHTRYFFYYSVVIEFVYIYFLLCIQPISNIFCQKSCLVLV